MYLHSLVVMFLNALRAFLSQDLSYPYRGMGLPFLSPQRGSERVYALGRRAGEGFRTGVRERLSRGSESAIGASGGSAHGGGTKRGSSASERLSGALARVRPGEGQGVGSDSSSRGLCQEVKSKRDKSLNPLTVIKIMCYNPGFLKTDISDIYLMSEILRFMMIFHHIADITDKTDKRYKTDLLDKMDKSEMSDISDLIPPYTTNPPMSPQVRHVGYQISLYPNRY